MILTEVEWSELKRILDAYSDGVYSEFNSDSKRGEWEELIRIVEASQKERHQKE